MSKGPIDLNVLGLGTVPVRADTAFTDLLRGDATTQGVVSPNAADQKPAVSLTGAPAASYAPQAAQDTQSLISFYGLSDLLDSAIEVPVDTGPPDVMPGLEFDSYGAASDEAMRLNGLGSR